MTTKKRAQRIARMYRREHPKRKYVVNVVQVSKGNWGIRFSPKGTRSRFDYRTERDRPRKRGTK